MSMSQSIASLLSSFCYEKGKGPLPVSTRTLNNLLAFVRNNFGKKAAAYIKSCFDDSEEKDDEGKTVWYAHTDPGESFLDWLDD